MVVAGATVGSRQVVDLHGCGTLRHARGRSRKTFMDVVLWFRIHTRAGFCNIKVISLLVPMGEGT
jgi:hypothetical protein